MGDTFFAAREVRTRAVTAQQVRSMLSADYQLDVHTLAPDTVSYRRVVTGGSDFALGHAQFTGELTGEAPSLPFFCVVQVQAGHQSVTAGKRSHVRENATPFLFPRHTMKRVRWVDTDLQQVILRPAAIDQELGRLNLPPLHQIELRNDPEPRAVPLWEAAAEYARAAAAAPLFAASPLAQETAFRALANGFVNAFTVGTSDPNAHRPDLSGAPATVRTALAYIDAHAGDALTVADIALQAGISSRGLQASFRAHLGHSPLRALRLARLHRAHTDLRNSHPNAGDTVTKIAARWGFTNESRFTQHYRALYGQSPATTLRSR